MPIINDFSDCCLELPSVVPSSLPTSISSWHRVSERVQRKLRFILRNSSRFNAK